MTNSCGAVSGSREPNPQAVSALTGFDPGDLALALLHLEEAMLDQADIIHNSGKWDRHFNRILDLRQYLESTK